MYTIITFLKDIVNYTGTLFPQVLEGLKVTMEIFLLTLILSIPLGVLVALGRLSKIKIINKLTGFYVLIMRGTPLLLQIVFIFFGLPNLNIVIDRFPAAIIAFTLNYAAYFGELVYERKLVPDSSPEKSVPYLLQAAESGNLTAQGLLAFKYRDGLGVPQDAAKAVEWFEKAASRKDLGAVMELGIMFRDGKYLPPDREKAFHWFEKGAEWKDPYSMAALADMLLEGTPSAEQAARALALYREAAAAGYFPAALKAAELLQNGKGGELDADEAYRLLRRVADAAGDPKAMYMLAQVYYTRGDEAQGDSLMKASAQAAYLPAMNRMARLHLLPDSSLPWNPVLSYYYWNQAGEMGDEKAASAAFWLLWGGSGIFLLAIFIIVWRFQRFAARRLAEQQKQEREASDDA